MHAPATPGDSVPGDAAGDDSEQGSGSNEHQTEQVTLTLNCDNDVVPAPSGAGTYDKGSTVTIEAVLLTPSENERGGITIYNFVQWSDGDYNRIREVVLNDNLSLTALYVAQDQ